MADNIYVKVGGVQKEVTALKTKVSGSWKNIEAAYTKVNGSWKKIFPGTVTLSLSGRSSNQEYYTTTNYVNYWYYPRGYAVRTPYNIPFANGIHYTSVSSSRRLLGYYSTSYGTSSRGNIVSWSPSYATVVSGYAFNTSNFTGYSRPTNYGDPSPIMFLPEGRYSPTMTTTVNNVTSSISVFGVRTRDYRHDTSLPVVKSGTQTIRISLTGTHGWNLRPDIPSVEVWGATTTGPKSSTFSPVVSTYSNRNGGLRGGLAYPTTPASNHYSNGPWRKLTNHYDTTVGLGFYGSALNTGFQTATINLPPGSAMYFGVSHAGGIYGGTLKYDITGATIEFTNA